MKDVEFAHSLAVITSDNKDLVSMLTKETETRNLRDLAYKNNTESIKAMIDPAKIPDTIAGKDSEEKKNNYAESIKNQLYFRESSAVIQRLVEAKDPIFPIEDANIRALVSLVF